MLACATYPALRHRGQVVSLKICFSSSGLKEGESGERQQNMTLTLEVSSTNTQHNNF